MKSGDFLCVIGKVGCGKTTLLQSIMGETFNTKGTSKISGSIAYVEQEPFIFPGTIKDNIMFGQPWNKPMMERAIELSQLTRDLQKFNKGLNTIIGERGINVSGG